IGWERGRAALRLSLRRKRVRHDPQRLGAGLVETSFGRGESILHLPPPSLDGLIEGLNRDGRARRFVPGFEINQTPVGLRARTRVGTRGLRLPQQLDINFQAPYRTFQAWSHGRVDPFVSPFPIIRRHKRRIRRGPAIQVESLPSGLTIALQLLVDRGRGRNLFLLPDASPDGFLTTLLLLHS